VGLFGTVGKLLGGAVSLASGLNVGGGGSTDPDAGRFRTNAERYAAAIAGDKGALAALLESSGKGTNPKAAWAHIPPRTDAYAKYQQALQVLAGKQVAPGAGAVASSPPQTIGSWLGLAPAPPASSGFDVTAPLGGPNAPPAWVWAAGGVAVVALLVSVSGAQRGRR
jgi:hypothetical protein